jgi:hypothetical protein
MNVENKHFILLRLRISFKFYNLADQDGFNLLMNFLKTYIHSILFVIKLRKRILGNKAK